MSAGNERLDNGELELHSLNVGQADAAVVITEEGQIILNDADEDKIVDELGAVLADRTIERTADGNIPLTFATTHLHQDHIKGLETLGLSEYEVTHAIQPDESRIEIYDAETEDVEDGISKEMFQKYISDLETLGVEKITPVSCGDTVPIHSDATLSVLAPPATSDSVDVTRVSTGADVNLPSERLNENSAVYKLEGERSALFMGDVQDKSDHYGESWLIQQHDNPENDVNLSADVLFVAHHGSANATSEEFLERVDPERAIISSDFGEQHGHPTDEVLKNLHDQDVAVSWTAGHGTLRTDLNSETARSEPTTDLGTTNAADLAALKYYCREHDVSPEQIEALTPDHLPDETPEWVAESAPMMVETLGETVDAAIANSETVEDVRHTLEATPDAHDQLREGVQADRDEHVTTRADVKRNREAYFSAKEKERDYKRLPLHTRLRANLPTRFGGINHPLNDVPSSDNIDGPRKVEEVPRAVRHQPAAEHRANGEIGKAMATYLHEAEEAADTAVDTTETRETLCRRLRDTPGAHQDFLYAIETPDAHEKNKPDRDQSESLEQSNQREQTNEQPLDQDSSLSL